MKDISFGSGRGSRFGLCLQGGSVFADFDVDKNSTIFAARVSFDGYGCCECPSSKIGRMSQDDSRMLLDMLARRTIEVEVAATYCGGIFCETSASFGMTRLYTTT
jgi:hypothetical protein